MANDREYFAKNFMSKKSIAFLKENFLRIIIWPVAFLLLISVVWAIHLSKITESKKNLQQNALKNVAALSHAYAQYLTRTLEQIDQVSNHVRYDWETTKGALLLEDLRIQGLFTASQFAFVAIIDKYGVPRTSTAPMEQWQDLAIKKMLFFHKHNNSSAMQIVLPGVVNSSGKPVIHFTRRLETSDESFDGIAVISVDPTYFSGFYDEQSFGKLGILAALNEGRREGTARIGNKVHLSSRDILDSSNFSQLEEGQAFIKDKQIFTDKKARYIGWRALNTYPLTAVVGISDEELQTNNAGTWQENRNFALAATFFLLIFGGVATNMASRLAWKNFQAKEVHDTYRLATEGTEDGFYMVKAVRNQIGAIVDFQYIDCNERGAGFFGLNREELIGVNMSSLQNENYFKTLLGIYSNAIETGFYEDEYEVSPDSPIGFAWARRRLARSGSGLAVTIRDISSKKQSEQEFIRLANHDGLTGLYNRHWLLNYLPDALARARVQGQMLGLLFIDLDGFKNINDTEGHAAGDHLLKSVASRLQSVLRPSDNVVRLGGDEFLVALEPVQQESEPRRVAERIIDAFKQPFWWNGGKLLVGASIGISLSPKDGDDAETLLKNADIAMYSVKAAGKGHFNFYKPELYARIKARVEMEQALVQALDLDQFVLHYQPRVNTLTGELTSMEALIRWIHPERGMISPLDFIPLAESTGLILRLGDAVITKACAQLQQWKHEGLNLIPVSINVSARQFQAGDLHKKLSSNLSTYDIHPHYLEVEITESSMMGEDNQIIAELAAIRSLGLELLVDDFGTGYSSLSQLQRLDMDVLKIDRVFTNELVKNKQGEIFFKAIVSMAHALDMTVVAEGVETREQLDKLRELHCDEIQGYFVSKPLPPEQIPALMKKRFLFPD